MYIPYLENIRVVSSLTETRTAFFDLDLNLSLMISVQLSAIPESIILVYQLS